MGCKDGVCGLPDEVLKHDDKIDFLALMMKMQHDFEAQLGYKIQAMTEPQRAEYIKEQSLMVEHELHEMLQEVPFFKPWKKYSDVEANYSAWERARHEYVDVLHFFLAVGLALGFTPIRLYMMYLDKMNVNLQRQTDVNNYKKAIKDEEDE